MKSTLQRHWLAIVLILIQAIVVISISVAASPRWPGGDEPAYLLQSAMLRLGFYPPNPARPIIYPYILSLLVRVFGFETLWMRLAQGAALVATSALLYRLSLKILGRGPAILALLVFVFLPEPLFYTQRLVREPFTAFLLMATLEMVRVMIEREKPLFWFLAGIPAGLLVLMKPEFGSLLAFMAFVWAISAFRRREFTKRLIPWAVCGAVAVMTTLPAVSLAYRAYNEFIFVNTYAGYNWMLSYCGDIGDESLLKDFHKRDGKRYSEVNPAANKVLFSPTSNKPFRERDAKLGREAISCIEKKGARVAGMYGLRALSAALYAGPQAQSIYKGILPDGPQFISGTLKWQSFLLQIFIGLLLVPGILRLAKEERGWNAAITMVWYVLFYASVTYLARFKVGVWPVFALGAAAGAEYVRSSLYAKGRGRYVAAGWLVAVVMLFIVFPWLFGPVSSSTRGDTVEQEQRAGKAEESAKVFLINLSGNYERAGRPELLDKEFKPFVMNRLDRISESSLEEARKFFTERGMHLSAQIFDEILVCKRGEKSGCPGAR